ncbi:hypothetical protein KPHVMX_250399 [Klebsiella pneumoniae]|nr:hypothetical protein KPHVMX_250399 [Klebsiella pneumoniae]
MLHLRVLLHEALNGLYAWELIVLAIERHAVMRYSGYAHHLAVSVVIGVVWQRRAGGLNH